MSIAAIIGLIIGILELLLKIVIYTGQFVLAVANWLLDTLRAIFLLLGSWLGPVSNAVWGALQPESIKRAAILALSVASILWLVFSTVANDIFYIMINPFFFNIFSYMGHLGFSLAVGTFTFLADLARRLFHGPTKKQLIMIKEQEYEIHRTSGIILPSANE